MNFVVVKFLKMVRKGTEINLNWEEISIPAI